MAIVADLPFAATNVEMVFVRTPKKN